jgi:hypothetical protein
VALGAKTIGDVGPNEPRPAGDKNAHGQSLAIRRYHGGIR